MRSQKNIVLIGFMGSGKTSVAKNLRYLSNFQWIDTDDLVERRNGQSIRQIFETDGESEFRAQETAVLRELKNAAGYIISTGGGIIGASENCELLRAIGVVFWLQVTPQTVLERLKFDTKRPLLQTPDKVERVLQLLDERSPVYSETAHFDIVTDNRSITEIGKEIWEIFRNYGKI